MLILAISGWAKSGKDTAASLLISDYGFKRIAFADPLKEAVARDFNLDLPILHSQKEKERPILSMPVDPKDPYSKMIAEFMVKEFRTEDGKQCHFGVYVGRNGERFMGVDDSNNFVQLYWTARSLCILEGSTKRSADGDYWVKKALRTAREAGYEGVVISDLRYRNELRAMEKSLGPDDKLVSIRINRFDTTSSSDPSERDLDYEGFDFVIENRGSMEDFVEKIKEVLWRLNNGQ